MVSLFHRVAINKKKHVKKDGIVKDIEQLFILCISTHLAGTVVLTVVKIYFLTHTPTLPWFCQFQFQLFSLLCGPVSRPPLSPHSRPYPASLLMADLPIRQISRRLVSGILHREPNVQPQPNINSTHEVYSVNISAQCYNGYNVESCKITIAELMCYICVITLKYFVQKCLNSAYSC